MKRSRRAPHGIPTEYKGVLFRSRLEARWAAFFEHAGWRWDYEPLELRGYIPDFALAGPKPTIVEVKPVMQWPEFAQHHAKIEAAGWSGPILILGARWFEAAARIVLGELFEPGPAPPAAGWGPAVAFQCSGCAKWSFTHGKSPRPACMLCGAFHEGGAHIAAIDAAETSVPLANLWAGAGNRTQWRGPLAETRGFQPAAGRRGTGRKHVPRRRRKK